MRVELRRGVAVHRARAVVLERGRDPAARRLGRMIAADARLHVPLTLFKGGRDTGAMGLAYPIVAADERGERDAFRCGERRIPSGTMRHGRDRLAVLVGIGAGRLVLDQRRTRERMLAVGQPLELGLLDRTHEPPLGRQTPVPLAPDLVGVGVVVRPRVREFLRVIGAAPARR